MHYNLTYIVFPPAGQAAHVNLSLFFFLLLCMVVFFGFSRSPFLIIFVVLFRVLFIFIGLVQY